MPTFAKCSYCQQEMSPGSNCTQQVYDDFADGVPRPRVPFVPMFDDIVRCSDCNVRPGGFHHPGCDLEQCPECGGQAISCDCESTGDDDDEADL